MKSCYLCKSRKLEYVEGNVRDMPDMKIQKCTNCSLIFLEDFSHITDDFYEKSGMVYGDPVFEMPTMWEQLSVDAEHRVSWQNRFNASLTEDTRRFKALRAELAGKVVLDFGCGPGGFIKQANGVAKEANGVELERECWNYNGRSEYSRYGRPSQVYGSLCQDVIDKGTQVVTMFHVLEHLSNPRKTLKDLFNVLEKGGKIVIEVPNSEDALLSSYRNVPFSKFTHWKCHLFLFNATNLTNLLKQCGFKNVTVKQVQRYPISNHMYWLQEGKPDGHKAWTFLNEPDLEKAYENTLAKLGKCDTLFATAEK